ncbi:kinase-like domain-containing protein [Thamnocephalis sphaerospora]|uniref:Kinase-like domain-containing protein n=1 Tax=Thamnocephalis sphaerospora TaxID=78915 RepID=A0A4V1IWQ9_9FUNG|nr:kinase-like domain-containing protein [Thamnocephalis sphaerospora]|eukprot:RKP08419.1 kinase-like domain-containing protein [Thamnocephalis sphaerospora]
MRSFATILLAAAVVALCHVSTSSAVPTNVPSPSTDPTNALPSAPPSPPSARTASGSNAPSISPSPKSGASSKSRKSKLIVESILTRTDSKTYTALVQYNDKAGFLKCTGDKEVFDNERVALTKIHAGDPSKYGISPRIKEAFVGLTAVLSPNKGSYCLVLERLDGWSLENYAALLGNPEKDAYLPSLFSQVINGIRYMNHLGLVHGDIKPENIMIKGTSFINKPVIVIVDFGMSQVVGESGMGYFYGGTMGYLAPEDVLDEQTDLYKRDTWMLGATLYASLAGLPPYNSIGVLESVERQGKNLFPPIETSKNAQLLALMNKMLVCSPAQRPKLSDLSDPLIEPYEKTISAALQQE